MTDSYTFQVGNSKTISIRVPDELLARIDAVVSDRYTTHKGTTNRSLLVLDAVVAYLATFEPPSAGARERELDLAIAKLKAEVLGLKAFALSIGYDPADFEDKYTIEGG